MHDERDEPHLTGQIAGMIAMMSALVKSLPPSTRKKLLHQTQAEFESLLTAMSASAASKGPIEREGVEWMRDLFLKRIAHADSKQKSRKAPTPVEPGQRPALKKRTRAASESSISADVDIEL